MDVWRPGIQTKDEISLDNIRKFTYT